MSARPNADMALIALASVASTMQPHEYLTWLAAEAKRVAAECSASGIWDDSVFDAEEAADVLVACVGCMYAANEAELAERASDIATGWRITQAKEERVLG